MSVKKNTKTNWRAMSPKARALYMGELAKKRWESVSTKKRRELSRKMHDAKRSKKK